MERYEKSIGLKTIYLTLARRLHIILLVFIPLAAASVIVTQFVLKKTYQSTVSMSRGAGTVIATAQHTVMQSYIKDATENKEDPTKSGALVKAVEALKAENITITVSEINSGLSFATMANNSASFSFSFTSKKQSIVQPVLKAVSEAAADNMKNSGVKDYAGATVVSEASKAKKNSKENTYLLIALAASAVLALGVPFVYEIVSDEVYDKEDVEALGCESFTLTVSK